MLHRRAADPPPPVARRPSDFHRGYVWSLGVLAAVASALALFGLRGVLFSVFLAVFACLGLDPLVRLFQRRGLSRPWSIAVVMLLIVALLVTAIWIVLPLVYRQLSELVVSIPQEIAQLRASPWFDEANEASNTVFGALLQWIVETITDPGVLAAAANGLLGAGLTVASGISSIFFIAILALYFVASYSQTKESLYRLVAASHRASFTGYADRILENVGKYLSGMVTLAFFNASYSFVILAIARVPGAFVIALGCFFITLIPLIGTVLTSGIMTVIALIHSPTSALIVLVAMLIYMQVESYVFTPRVMSKAVKIPGSIVFISATAGASLFGLLGGLVAIPISAGVVLIVREVVIPEKQRQ
jgi:predicted PurR-regulated permease PerM